MTDLNIYPCPDFLQTKRLICLDIETTGLSPIWNNIIELGVVEVKNGKVSQEYSRVFGGGRSSAYLVRKIHGIKDCQRLGKKTFTQCAPNVAKYLEGATLVTHNGTKFDIPFLDYQMHRAGCSMPHTHHLDTIILAKKFNHKHNSLEYLCSQYHIPYDESNHRGLTDCLCTLQVLYALAQKYGESKIMQ